MTIQVTQFLRPDGRKREATTEVSNDCREGYDALLRAGCRLTAEMLSTGQISCTIEHPEAGDIDISVATNGPDVQKGLERMIREFKPDKVTDGEDGEKEVTI